MECASHSIGPDSSPPHGLQPTRLLCPWDFIDEDTGGVCRVDGSLFFLVRFSNETEESRVAAGPLRGGGDCWEALGAGGCWQRSEVQRWQGPFLSSSRSCD